MLKKAAAPVITLFVLIFTIYSALYSMNAPKVVLENAFPFTFKLPVFITPAPASFKAEGYFIIEKEGVIQFAYKEENTWRKSALIDMQNRVCSDGNEEGLLGLAVDPNFTRTNRLYIYYSLCGPRKTRVSRLTIKEKAEVWNKSKTISYDEEPLLDIDQPYSNHNGGHLEFGPDGYLYIAVGDGGSGGDPKNNAQNVRTLLGKILRIDVAPPKGYKTPADNPMGKYGAREIYAYGLRNPWRFSFDRKTGKLWAGDVGQNKYEEVSIISGGENYGWRLMEGLHCYKPSSKCHRKDLQPPVYEYDHDQGSSITGGYVYYGEKIPFLKGRYVFADFVEGKIWSIPQSGEKPNQAPLVIDTDYNISSFGMDNDGELFALDYYSGAVFRIASPKIAYE